MLFAVMGQVFTPPKNGKISLGNQVSDCLGRAHALAALLLGFNSLSLSKIEGIFELCA